MNRFENEDFNLSGNVGDEGGFVSISDGEKIGAALPENIYDFSYAVPIAVRFDDGA